jgi:hypothetical protein
MATPPSAARQPRTTHQVAARQLVATPAFAEMFQHVSVDLA